MPDDVKCSVSNCHYWNQGNRCGASEIMIDIDHNGDAELEFAQELGDEYKRRASESAATCCHTFRPKSS